MVWYNAEASMLTAPGMEAKKNNFSGEVLENKAVEFIRLTFLPFQSVHFQRL